MYPDAVKNLNVKVFKVNYVKVCQEIIKQDT